MTLIEQILISVISAIATALLTYFGFWRQAKAELKKEFESRFNERKWEVYLAFISLLPTISNLEKYVDLHNKAIFYPNQKKLNEQEEKMLNDLGKYYQEEEIKFRNELLLISSKKVIEAYIEWKNRSDFSNLNDEYCAEALIILVNAMREDLGNEKSIINFRNLEGLYYYKNNPNNISTEKNQPI